MPHNAIASTWRRVMGDNAVIRTNPRWDGMVRHLGYISVDAPQGIKDILATVITTDTELVQNSQKALRETKVIPDEELTERALLHLKLAREIASDYSGVRGIYASIIPPASDRARTAGLFDRGTSEIMLNLVTLEHAGTTIDTMVHEIGHYVAGQRVSDPMKAEDLQPAHSEAMTYVAAEVFRRAAKGAFDEYLKGATW